MKLIRKVGATSEIWQIFIADSSSTTGAGLTGLAYNTASLTAYYHRDTDTTATAISLVTMTVGTFTSSGFKEIDATNMPGWYQFCPPNAALASGAKSCSFHLKGATNMAPLPIEVDLDAQVDVTSWNGTAVASPATAGIPDINVKNINNVSASSVTTVSAYVGSTGAAINGTNVNTLSSHDPGATLGTSTLTQTQVTGGAYALNSASFAFNAALPLTTQQKADVTAAVPTAAANATAALTTAMTESYAADGAAPTLAQMQFMLWSFWSEVGISGVTKTTKKLDGSTAMTFTLDSATQPTSITRAS